MVAVIGAIVAASAAFSLSLISELTGFTQFRCYTGAWECCDYDFKPNLVGKLYLK